MKPFVVPPLQPLSNDEIVTVPRATKEDLEHLATITSDAVAMQENNDVLLAKYQTSEIADARYEWITQLLHAPRAQARAEFRQMLIDLLDVWEQSDDELAVLAALEAYDQKCNWFKLV